jgi:hypothetical protein
VINTPTKMVTRIVNALPARYFRALANSPSRVGVDLIGAAVPCITSIRKYYTTRNKNPTLFRMGKVSMNSGFNR